MEKLNNFELVAVYGSLKRGFGNYRVMQIANGTFITTGISKDTFSMDGSGFPYIVDNSEGYPVFVEIFKAPKEGVLGALDSLEGHPTFYCREKRKFDTHQGELEAWIYIYQGEITPNPSLLEDIDGDIMYNWKEQW